jgi:hypothetical protein
MGALSSSVLADIFLQHTEHLHLSRLSEKHSIINYFRYVDDILVVFDPNHTNIQAILEEFNAIHPKLQFMREMEANNTLSYLDVLFKELLPTGRPPSPENQYSLTPLSLTLPTTQLSINMQQLNFCITD